MVTAIPVGPVLFMVIQKTLGEGRMSGMSVGLGSAIADTTWAALGLFALGLVSEFISDNESKILFFGGLLVVFIGIVMFFRTPKSNEGEKKQNNHTGNVFQAILCAVSNPGAFAVMMAMLAVMGLGAGVMKSPVWLVLVFVFLGEMLYWTLLTFILSRTLKIKFRTVRIMSRVAGVCVSVFGVVLLVRSLVMYL